MGAPEKRAVLESLRAIERFPTKRSDNYSDRGRNTVMGRAGEMQGFCLGKAIQYGVGACESQYNRKFPQLWKDVRRLMRAYDPKFRYNSVQINKNLRCAPHTDRNNVGMSIIIALGDFTGGDLVYDGKPCVIRNRFKLFDGSNVHATTPFHGERYSLVYYTRKLWTT